MKQSYYSTLLIFVIILFCGTPLWAQQKVSDKLPWSVRMTESEMIRCPQSWQLDFQPTLKWDYCHGLELGAMLDVYDRYGDKKIRDYATAYADTMVHADGSITTYKLTEYSLDRINSGKIFFRIYEQTKDEKYRKALDLLYSQFAGHPRNADGGFWHKKVYPHQMWLDGLYMGAPFYAEYAFRNNLPQAYADVINQFVTSARHTYDPKNGLYRHACDVSHTERWADPVTGQSQHCWGRALGWYAMALVDVLDFIPKHEAGRDSVLAILNNVAVQLKKLQDPKTGQWYQVLDRSGDPGNYLESSCSAMFIYSLFKAVRMGYISKSYLNVALKGYRGFLKTFIEVDKNGLVTITKACAVAGLGGKVYRSGDYDYYIHEKIRNNDPKAVGPFIKASLEYESLPPQPQDSSVPLAGDTLVVARDGSGKYRTVGEAVEAVRAFMDYTVTIYIKKGTYKEKLVIPSWVKNVQIVGEDAAQTIITYDDHANINKMGTFRTYTVKVEGSDITFKNLTIENNAAQLGQAVALHTEGDRLMFINCRFLGNQDTIFTGSEGTHLLFSHCYIEGTTDFIFGPSTVLFEYCEILSKRNSYVTAASTPKNIEYGYVFKNCKLTAAPGVTKVYLGRPWRPYAATVFINCELGSHICPAGWQNWSNPANEQTARYAEYKNTGAGANTSERVKWAKQLTDKEAAQYTPQNIFKGSGNWYPLSAFRADKPVFTVFMIGDSTMANKKTDGGNPERGWGMMLPEFFSEEVRIDNHAVNGRSSKSFIDEGRWDKVLSLLQPSDYVFIQFGHNDEKPKPDRHTDPGTTFDANLRRFVNETRAKGGIPVLFNSIVRRNFVKPDSTQVNDPRYVPGEREKPKEGKVLYDTHGAYLLSPRNVAKELNVPFVDMNKLTHDLVEGLGPKKSKKLFMFVKPNTVPAIPKGREDNTHLNIYGARLIAGMTADLIAKKVPALAPYVVHPKKIRR